MNKWVKKLTSIAAHPGRTVLGLMSGTSMDGIDMALCRVRGASLDTDVDVLKFETVPVEEELKDKFYSLAYNPDAPTGKVLQLQAQLNKVWCKSISDQLQKWNVTASEIDLIASHGQTLLHQPDPRNNYHGTLQIVDGDVLAQYLDIITVTDFRQKHIAAGYEGAPLAPLAEVLLFSDQNEDRILLNLGGIANFTLLKAGMSDSEVPFATDTGPANTLLDAAVKRLIPGKIYDADGKTARSGNVHQKLLTDLLDHPFFKRAFPKSTGQEEFHWDWMYKLILKAGPDFTVNDLLSTLTELTAVSVSDAIKKNLKQGGGNIFVSGGGWKNGFLIDRLRTHLSGFDIRPSSELGLNPDAKEAALFAVLANELLAGEGWINRDGKRFTLGKISLPG